MIQNVCFFSGWKATTRLLASTKNGMDGGFGGVKPWSGGFGGCNILRPRSGEKLGEAELVQKKRMKHELRTFGVVIFQRFFVVVDLLVCFF